MFRKKNIGGGEMGDNKNSKPSMFNNWVDDYFEYLNEKYVKNENGFVQLWESILSPFERAGDIISMHKSVGKVVGFIAEKKLAAVHEKYDALIKDKDREIDDLKWRVTMLEDAIGKLNGPKNIPQRKSQMC